jgi:hypothetical protein
LTGPLDDGYIAYMISSHDEGVSLVRNSTLYREFLAEREEILRHKWIESEKVGHDIGFEKALLEWVLRHRGGWRQSRGLGHRTRSAVGAN